MRNTLISHTANADQIVILQYEVHQVSGLYPVQYSQMSGVRTYVPQPRSHDILWGTLRICIMISSSHRIFHVRR